MTIELAKAKQILVGGASPENLQDYLDITLEASIGNKVDKDGAKVLSDKNFSAGEQAKLGGLPTPTALTASLEGKVDKAVGKSLIADTPAVDGKQYAIQDGAWAEVVAGTGDVEEAPIDGKQYARKDATWEEVAAGGGDVEEAPLDGGQYLRSGGTWQRYIGEQIAYADYPMVSGEPHKFTPADFPDTSFVYQGAAETDYGDVAYRAEYSVAFQMWIVELTYQTDTYKVAFIGGDPSLIASRFVYSVAQEYLPSDLSSIVYRGVFDILSAENSDSNFSEITFSVGSGYVADTVTETLNIPKAPISISTDVAGSLFASLSLSFVPDTVSLTKDAFAYGFGKGKMYREASFEPSGSSLKISFFSEQAGVAAYAAFEVPVPSQL